MIRLGVRVLKGSTVRRIFPSSGSLDSKVLPFGHWKTTMERWRHMKRPALSTTPEAGSLWSPQPTSQRPLPTQRKPLLHEGRGQAGITVPLPACSPASWTGFKVSPLRFGSIFGADYATHFSRMPLRAQTRGTRTHLNRPAEPQVSE